MNESEALAKLVVERLLPGSCAMFNQIQSNSEPDFFLKQSDGSEIPLEVTRSTEKPYLSFWAALQKYEARVRCHLCRNSWIVCAYDPAAKVKQIRKGIDSYLSKIEKTGLNSFNHFLHCHEHKEVKAIYDDLWIASGRAVKEDDSRTITICPPTLGASGYEETALVSSIEAECQKSDNLCKMQGKGQIAVIVEWPKYKAWSALEDIEELPSLAPDIPSSVEVVWLIAKVLRKSKTYRVISFSWKDGWVDHGLQHVSDKEVRNLTARAQAVTT